MFEIKSLWINKYLCLCYHVQVHVTQKCDVDGLTSASSFFLGSPKCEDLIRKLCHSVIPIDKNHTLKHIAGHSFPANNTAFYRTDQLNAPSTVTANEHFSTDKPRVIDIAQTAFSNGIHRDLVSHIFCKSVRLVHQTLIEIKSSLDSPCKRAGFKSDILYEFQVIFITWYKSWLQT